MQAVLDVAVYSIITLGPPFVVGLEDGPFISFPVVLLCTGVQGVSILIKFRMTFIQPMEPLFTSWTYSWGSLLIRSSIILASVGMRHCFFIWPGFPQLKHLALAAFCTLKVSNVANFSLWDIDLLSLHASNIP